MKLQRYLTEQQGLTAGEIMEILEKDCGPFLKEVREGRRPVWRGTWKSFSDDLVRLSPRKDRRPLDTPPHVHDTLDKAFQKKFGWRPRSTGVFCSTEYTDAIIYGRAYMFFAIGKFDVLWRKDVSDQRNLQPHWLENVFDDPKQAAKDYLWYAGEDVPKNKLKSLVADRDELEFQLVELLKIWATNTVNKYTKGLLGRALKSQEPVELMFRCGGYYLVPYDFLQAIRPLWRERVTRPKAKK
jgi:hypothetical protein